VQNGALTSCAMLALLTLGLTCARADTVGGAAQPTQWHRTNIHGHRIYYAVRGNGPTLVFLHGGGDSGEHSFARQLDVFSEHHFIVAPDQVGQGRTPDVPGPLSYTAMMEDTAELLKVLKFRKVDVVGFSDGGILALMLEPWAAGKHRTTGAADLRGSGCDHTRAHSQDISCAARCSTMRTAGNGPRNVFRTIRLAKPDHR